MRAYSVQVQEQFARNVHKGGRTGKVSNLFTHLIKCGYCGRAMHHTSKGEFQYLVCDNAASGAGCYYGSVRYQKFERTILDYCRDLDPSEFLPGHEERESLIRNLNLKLSTSQAKAQKLTKEAQNLRTSIRESRDEKVKKFLEEDLPTVLTEKETADKDVEEIKRELKNASEVLEKTEERIKSLAQLYERMDKAEDQELIDLRLALRTELRRLIKRIDVYPEGLAQGYQRGAGKRHV